jgi:haloalkane dehalogenase
MPVAAAERYTTRRAEVLGRRMAYVDVGEGDPIVFLHGNPTSSYLWRNVIPHVEGRGRCIAPDLIGMGSSDKLETSGPERYRFVEHREYLDALLDQLDVRSRATLVLHDWGSALGFDWARRNAEAVSGIAYMEAIVMPLRWEEWPRAVRPVFEAFRSPQGETMVLEQNLFVEQVLPGAGESRRPTLTWPREIPIEGEPADVTAIVEAYGAWLRESPVPKLFVDAEPGAILRGEARDFCRSWPNQSEVQVAGIHFVQEDSPDEIGSALAAWMAHLGAEA